MKERFRLRNRVRSNEFENENNITLKNFEH